VFYEVYFPLFPPLDYFCSIGLTLFFAGFYSKSRKSLLEFSSSLFCSMTVSGFSRDSIFFGEGCFSFIGVPAVTSGCYSWSKNGKRLGISLLEFFDSH